MPKKINTISVDLTPILPGGENGGAKIFILELLSRLAAKAPQTQFKLLTHSASHEELATMECKNVTRSLIAGTIITSHVAEKKIKARLPRVVIHLLSYLPRPLKLKLIRISHYIEDWLKYFNVKIRVYPMHPTDLLFCPFTAPTYFKSKTPTVCTIYDLQYKTYPQFFEAQDNAHRHRTFVEACKKASKLAVISDYSRGVAIKHGKLASDRIKTIHLRMSQRIVPSRNEKNKTLARLHLQPQSYILYPANFWKHKNHEMLFTAFNLLCQDKEMSSIKLVCTGSPGERQAWLMQARCQMHLEDRILFPGYISNEDLSILLSQARGVVFPSLYEGFGIPVIEAMAAGIPVACSNVTSLPEVAGDAAILFSPAIPTDIAKAMKVLITDEALREQLIKKGYERAAEFADIDRMADEYWALFEEAVNS